MTTINKKSNAKEKGRDDISSLAEIVSDINQKVSQITDQLSDIHAAMDAFNDSVRYGRDYKDYETVNDDN